MVIFHLDFFNDFIPKVLITSISMFDMWLARLIMETSVSSSCEGDHGNCMQIHGKWWQWVNEEEFLGIGSYAEDYEGIECRGGEILLKNQNFDSWRKN